MSAGEFARQVMAHIMGDRTVEMTDLQRAEIERMVRRGNAARAEAEGMPPPWAVSLAQRLDRIEDLLAEIAERREETR